MCLFIAGKLLQHAVFKFIPFTSALDFCELRNLGLQYGLTSILAWICNCIHYKVWDDITFPFPNSTEQLLNFGNVRVISFHTLLGSCLVCLVIWQGQYCVCSWLKPIWDLTVCVSGVSQIETWTQMVDMLRITLFHGRISHIFISN